MTAADWSRIESIFLSALEMPPAAREAFVAEACGDDPVLAREVRSMLAGAERGTTIERGINDAVGQVASEAVDDPGVASGALQPGARVDRYRIVRELGRGGLSTVYLAERDDGDFEMQVALKVVRRGLDTDDIVERLRRERQILAHLVHPNIARLLDGGTTTEGLPYFVLEAIEGHHIDTFCVVEGLDARRRLELFADVCDAVEHAHRSLVLHRDLKPSNIMVTADGVPKLLDFGIAKVLSGGIDDEQQSTVPEALAAATLTEPGQRILTPQYASPEQIRGLPLTTASDVYSLGAVLYLLLSGRLPYDLRGKSLLEVERTVLEEEPRPPSTHVASRSSSRADWSRAQSSTAQSSSARVSGARPSAAQPGAPAAGVAVIDRELDAITLQALRKDPARRYATVRDLSADVRRYLSGRPVSARGDSLRYRVAKFLRRHWLPVAAAVLVASSLATTVVFSTWQARIAAAERTVAERERDRATRVRDFVVELFSWADPDTLRGGEVTARELLDAGAVSLLHGLDDEPALRSELHGTVADIYRRLALYDEAESQARAAVEALESADPSDPITLARYRTELAWILLNRSRYGEAQLLALEAERSLDGLDAPAADAVERARVQVDRTLGTIARFEGQPDVALGRLERALDRSVALEGPASLTTATVQADLGAAFYEARRYREAEETWTAALAVRREVQGLDHPETLVLLNDLAVVATKDGRLEDAEARFGALLERYRSIYGKDHVATSTALYNLAQTKAARAERDEDSAPLLAAIVDLEQSVEINEQVFGAEHTEVARSLFLLALYRLRAERVEEALEPARRAASIRRTLFGAEASTTKNAAALVETIEAAASAGDREKAGGSSDLSSR